MYVKVGKQFLVARAEPPFEVVVNGKVRPGGGVFDRFHEAVEVRELLADSLISTKTNEIYPLQLPPPFHFAGVVSDRDSYPVGAKVYLIHRLEKGVEYQQSLEANRHYLMYQRSLKSDEEWYIQCLEGLGVGEYRLQLARDQERSVVDFRVTAPGPSRAPAIPYREVDHYDDSTWESCKRPRRLPGSPERGRRVEIVTPADLECTFQGQVTLLRDTPKFVPHDHLANWAHRVHRELVLCLGDRRQPISISSHSSPPVFLGGENFAGEVGWPGAQEVDGLHFSGRPEPAPEQAEVTGVCDQGPWLISYALAGDQESFCFHPPTPVPLQLRRHGRELELESPVSGQAVLVLSDPESAGPSLRQPYARTLLSWLKAASFSCHQGPLSESELHSTGNTMFLKGRPQVPEVSFSWGNASSRNLEAEPVEMQAVQVLELAAHTPVKITLPTEGRGHARLYLFSAGRLHTEELSW